MCEVASLVCLPTETLTTVDFLGFPHDTLLCGLESYSLCGFRQKIVRLPGASIYDGSTLFLMAGRIFHAVSPDE
jgi:hypothetical protein